jgi:hypothetical protein
MKRIITGLLLIIQSLAGFAQIRNVDSGIYNAAVAMEGIATSDGVVPFWMRSNQYGSVPLEGVSGSILASGIKEYNYEKHTVLDWGAGVEGRVNMGNSIRFVCIQAYAKVHLSIFQLQAGRFRQREGLMDSTLSSGSFTYSGNSLGIPQIQLSIPDYYAIPILGKMFAFKGDFSHGWMGKTPVHFGNDDTINTYYHHLSFYARLGKPNWKIKFYGAINHDVVWGNEPLIYGSDSSVKYTLSTLKSFFYVITGKRYSFISKIGNHVGSLDLATEYEQNTIKVRLYHQFFYDKGALYHLANVMDGLSGVSFEKKGDKPDAGFSWKKILLEVFYSKGQAGGENAIHTPSGPEYYYNHAIYRDGFSYKGSSIGTPLITTAHDARKGQASNIDNYFINNRVIAFNIGFIGNIQNWNIMTKLTYSKNYGDYTTSGITRQWILNHYVTVTFPYGIFTPVNQFSAYIEASRRLKKNYSIAFVFATDYGDLLYNSLGGMVKLTKSW